jgi:hypothetical protein
MTIELSVDGFLYVCASLGPIVLSTHRKTDSWLWLVAVFREAVLQCGISRNLITRSDSVGEGDGVEG